MRPSMRLTTMALSMFPLTALAQGNGTPILGKTTYSLVHGETLTWSFRFGWRMFIHFYVLQLDGETGGQHQARVHEYPRDP